MAPGERLELSTNGLTVQPGRIQANSGGQKDLLKWGACRWPNYGESKRARDIRAMDSHAVRTSADGRT